MPVRSHSSASARASSRSRALSGGSNLAVERRTREPFAVPTIRTGHFAPRQRRSAGSIPAACKALGGAAGRSVSGVRVSVPHSNWTVTIVTVPKTT